LCLSMSDKYSYVMDEKMTISLTFGLDNNY
jgi:hypothetical protein